MFSLSLLNGNFFQCQTTYTQSLSSQLTQGVNCKHEVAVTSLTWLRRSRNCNLTFTPCVISTAAGRPQAAGPQTDRNMPLFIRPSQLQSASCRPHGRRANGRSVNCNLQSTYGSFTVTRRHTGVKRLTTRELATRLGNTATCASDGHPVIPVIDEVAIRRHPAWAASCNIGASLSGQLIDTAVCAKVRLVL